MSIRNHHAESLSEIVQQVAIAIAIGLVLVGIALFMGFHAHLVNKSLSVVGTSLILESQPAAAEAVVLRMPPLLSAGISLLANLAPLPFITVGLRTILGHWKWAQKHVQKAQKWAARLERYGSPALIVAAPFLGAYMCFALGHTIGWTSRNIWTYTLIGMFASVFAISYGGHWVAHFFIPSGV